MLFHEQTFLFLFLPVAWIGLIAFSKIVPTFALWWIIFCSLFFYGFHGWEHLPILLSSLVINFFIGRVIESKNAPSTSALILSIGIIVNLGFLAFFKYADFLLYNLASLKGTKAEPSGIALPLAISFFTFQQIAYLVDLNKGKITTPVFSHYCFFITFFPQLIAGPIVRCQNIIPQIIRGTLGRLSKEVAWTGLCIFSIGLFKKTFLADGIRPLADSIFSSVDGEVVLSLLEAWVGAFAFGLQIYFDFSAYSEMALGIGLLFGLRLPLNFNSPYKAVNIIEFWRRWHITLSEFLRDYLYKPLGGNRKGVANGIVNAVIVMLIGGLWHGAAWTFVAWGLIHGLLIGINHLFRAVKKTEKKKASSVVKIWICRLVTFFCVTLAWVFFRSQGFDEAFQVLKSMLGFNGFDLSRSLAESLPSEFFKFNGFLPNKIIDITILPLLPFFFIIVWCFPNTMELLKVNVNPSLKLQMPSSKIIFLAGAMLFFSIKMSFEQTTYEFLYFRF
ncbi:MAG: MBOAT family protein [Opitutae bacterium]|nr:MBOAT family protein [Opitutae bacterium]